MQAQLYMVSYGEDCELDSKRTNHYQRKTKTALIRHSGGLGMHSTSVRCSNFSN